MGGPMTYVFVEFAPGCRETVHENLDAWREDWSTVTERSGTLASRRHGTDRDGAAELIETLAAAAERALVVHLTDTGSTGVGEGLLFERVGDETRHVETIQGGEGAGHDVVDYARRQYGLHATMEAGTDA